MPKGLELAPQQKQELLLQMKRQSLITKAWFASDFRHPTQYADEERYEPVEIQHMSDTVTDLMQDRLNDGSRLYIYDGSHGKHFLLQQEREAEKTRLRIEEHGIFTRQDEAHVLEDQILAAQFEQNDGNGIVEMHIIAHDGNQLVISSDGINRPKGFYIVAEKEIVDNGKVVDIVHEVLVGRADNRGSLRMGNAYKQGRSEKLGTAWLIAGTPEAETTE